MNKTVLNTAVLLTLLFLITGCSSLVLTTNSLETSNEKQGFLGINITSITIDAQGNASANPEYYVNYDPPKAGWKYVLLNLEANSDGSSSVNFESKSLKFYDKANNELDSYIFYPEDFTGQSGKEGFVPLKSQLNYSQSVSPSSPFRFKILIEAGENEDTLVMSYENMQPTTIKIQE